MDNALEVLSEALEADKWLKKADFEMRLHLEAALLVEFVRGVLPFTPIAFSEWATFYRYFREERRIDSARWKSEVIAEAIWTDHSQ